MSIEHHTPSIAILHVPAGGGHRAAAHAIAEAARARGLEAEVLDALDFGPHWFRQTYVSGHIGSTSLVPSLYGGAYFALNHRSPTSESIRRSIDCAIGAALLRKVQSLQAEAVVCTHFYPLTVLGEARARGLLDAAVIGVVTDYAAHAVWAEPHADALCAAPGRAVADLIRHGAAPCRIVETGIPVRPSFGAIAPIDPIGPGDELRVLVTCGGFGVGPMLGVLRSFTGVANVRLTVVCGDNPALVRAARGVCARHGLDAEVLGYERDMPRQVAQAHVVVGKPGGLTVTECLSAGRPMVLVGAVPGQETCNQKWVAQCGAAIARAPHKVGAMLARLRDSGTLQTMAAAARTIARPNAADDVVSAVLATVRKN
jgi:processive 1,2-diacylglycerol beta-glucosyltransferase